MNTIRKSSISVLAVVCLGAATFLSAQAAQPDDAKDASESQLPTNALNVSPLLIGERMPELQVWDDSGQPVNIKTVANDKPLVLVFYRGGTCPFCNVQLGRIQSVTDRLVQMGYSVVGISPDTPKRIREFKENKKLDYQLISDMQSHAARAFGVAYSSNGVRKSWNAERGELEEIDESVLVVPSIFIIDALGTIRFHYINPTHDLAIEPELLLVAAENSVRPTP